jgi:hypothetical protein
VIETHVTTTYSKNYSTTHQQHLLWPEGHAQPTAEAEEAEEACRRRPRSRNKQLLEAEAEPNLRHCRREAKELSQRPRDPKKRQEARELSQHRLNKQRQEARELSQHRPNNNFWRHRPRDLKQRQEAKELSQHRHNNYWRLVLEVSDPNSPPERRQRTQEEGWQMHSHPPIH